MLIANILVAAVAVLSQGELTVRPNHCPDCPFFMRISEDGKTGFVNTARVSEADYPKMAARALHLMQQATNDLGAVVRPVKAEDGCVTLVKDCETANGTARYLAFFNASDAERDISVAFESLALGGNVRVFDLVERADRGVFKGRFEASVPAHGARFFRLDAEERLAFAARGGSGDE